MSYFRERNGLHQEYSGYETASEELRARISSLISQYTTHTHGRVIVMPGTYVYLSQFENECALVLNQGNYRVLVNQGKFEEVFEVVEIFLKIANESAFSRYASDILPDIQRAFVLSGSVYFVNDEGQVHLRPDEEMMNAIEATESVLKENESALITFRQAVIGLLERRVPPRDVVRDTHVALEDFLKRITGEKDFSSSLKKLFKDGMLEQVQILVLEKLHGYRSDAYRVTHAGNSPEPGELDASWYLETVMAQIKYIWAKNATKASTVA